MGATFESTKIDDFKFDTNVRFNKDSHAYILYFLVRDGATSIQTPNLSYVESDAFDRGKAKESIREGAAV
jgi:hypothetical protein